MSSLPPEMCVVLARTTTQAVGLGVRVWLVGGVVRDLLLRQQPGRDLDLAVEGDATALAAALAAVMGGRVVAAYGPFGTATVEVPVGEHQPPLVVDLARTRVEHYPHPAALPEVTPAPIEVDLARRDFSVNAMALELVGEDGEPRAGRFLDPYAGRDDLAARRLRLLHRLSLRDDPTRMLRGLRLAVRLGLHPDAATAAQIAEAVGAGYLGLLTPERVLAELCLALDEPRPDEVARVAERWGLVPQLVPGLAWSPELAARSERLVAAEGKDAALASGPLVWAGLLVYGMDETDLARLERRYPLPVEAATLLRQIVTLRRLATQLQGQPNSMLDKVLRPFSITAISVLHYAEPPAIADAAAHYLRSLRPVRAPLDGNDLQRLGVAPGPGLGRLLEQLRAATLDGVVRTPAEAEAWVRHQMKGQV